MLLDFFLQRFDGCGVRSESVRFEQSNVTLIGRGRGVLILLLLCRESSLVNTSHAMERERERERENRVRHWNGLCVGVCVCVLFRPICHGASTMRLDRHESHRRCPRRIHPSHLIVVTAVSGLALSSTHGFLLLLLLMLLFLLVAVSLSLCVCVCRQLRVLQCDESPLHNQGQRRDRCQRCTVILSFFACRDGPTRLCRENRGTESKKTKRSRFLISRSRGL